MQIYVNGYRYGKFVPHIGPQSVFPVPPGILNIRAGKENTLCISLWAMEEGGARLNGVELVAYGVYEIGFEGFERDWGKLQPGWREGREVYG